MKVLCYNLNGIRAREEKLTQLLIEQKPDIIGLQETKIADDLFPHATFEKMGYSVEYFGQKGNYGVALFSRLPIQQVSKEILGVQTDPQRRFLGITITTDMGELAIYNGYFPQGENRKHPTKFLNKAQFYRDIVTFFSQHHTPQDHVILMADFNVAHSDIDVGLPEHTYKRWLKDGICCFLPEERQWYQQMLDWGFFDSYRHLHPNRTEYSWFDYRSGGFEQSPKRGLRIDHILVSSPLLPYCRQADILMQYREPPKPSDHCPILLTLQS